MEIRNSSVWLNNELLNFKFLWLDFCWFRSTFTIENLLLLIRKNFSTFGLSLELELKFSCHFTLQIEINCSIIIYYTIKFKIPWNCLRFCIVICIVICYLTNLWFSIPRLYLKCRYWSINYKCLYCINWIIRNSCRFWSALRYKSHLFTKPAFSSNCSHFHVIRKGSFLFFVECKSYFLIIFVNLS